MLLPEDIIETLPGCCYWKQEPAEYAGCNSSAAELAGRKQAKLMVGVSDFDTPWDTKAEEILLNDQQVFSGKPLCAVEPLMVANGGYVLLYTEKRPHYDKTNKVDAIVGYSIEINKKPLLDLLANWIDKDKKTLACTGQSLFYSVEPCYERQGLTRRESECLFFLMRGLSAKQIAQRLNITARTVEAHTEHLKYKFRVSNKVELVVKAVELGLLNVIPASLVKNLTP